ncbi:FAD-dependent oxidoreductase [uncultured Methylobacterium sp.]|uniref:NAD(P)/FAD-dependent oxidoreductase n=1 Tax=uncultured Methylobacterium sp. TaxID=157278 RepID=UPI002592509D|nr:FAD-dependent oxidoreductase [uncultured Methylobacterium sp.]
MTSIDRNRVDLAIVGGGILGHVTALRAAEQVPDARIVLIERDLPASGASARSAGLHFPLGYRERVRAASSASQRYYEDLVRAWPEVPIVPLGLRVHCDPVREPWLTSLFAPEARLARLENAPGIWTAQGAHRADVPALVRWLRRHLAGRVRFLDGVRVERVAGAGEGVAIVMADGARLDAAGAVLAPGPWALDGPFRSLTEGTGLRIKRVAAFHVEAPVDAASGSIDLFMGDDAFLMPRADGLGYLFSFTRTKWDVDPDAAARGLDAGDRAEAEAVLARTAPHLAGRLGGGQVFCDAYGPAREPIVIRADTGDRIVFAGAANGSGYRLAPAMADEALRLLSFAPD